jgi:hypothetical protein
MTAILVVNGNHQNLSILKVLFLTKGFEVEQASNGAEANEPFFAFARVYYETRG